MPSIEDDENALTSKLEELDSLLDNDAAIVESKETTVENKIRMPVLDELVTEVDFIEAEDEDDLEKIEEQIIDLAEKLEHKICGELDQLVRLLKDNIKNTIIEELRTQANLDQDDPDLGYHNDITDSLHKDRYGDS